MFAQSRLSIGIGFGSYGSGAYPPPAYARYQPPCPGPGYTWVNGFWTTQSGRNVWTNGFWRAPLVTPRFNAFRGNDHDRDRGRFARNDRGDRHDDHGRDSRNFRH